MRSTRAFTLIELLVVVGVIVIITLVMLFRQTKYNSSTVLRSLAYNVALSIRQAQVYGTSIQGTGGVFASGYGVHFSTISPKNYTIFADANSDGQRAPSGTEDVKTFTLNNGYTVSEFCVYNNLSTIHCSAATHDTTGAATINSLDIVFKRPNPDAYFYATLAGVSVGTYAKSYITIRATDGTTRALSVTTTGQISVVSNPNTAPTL